MENEVKCKWDKNILRPERFIKPVDVFPQYEQSDTVRMFSIMTKEDFIKALWFMVREYGIGPIGCGNWFQSGDRLPEEFFQRDYKYYAEGITSFAGADKYMMQYMEDTYRPKIYVTNLTNIKERYKELIKQFEDGYKDTSPYYRIG